MKIVLLFFALVCGIAQAGEEVIVPSKIYTEEVIFPNGASTMKIWEAFEVEITNLSKITFEIFKGNQKISEGKVEDGFLKAVEGDIPQEKFFTQEITVVKNGKKILRMRFKHGTLPTGTTLHIKAI